MAVPLTQRQLEILALYAAGLNSTKIANRLFLSVRTVENHQQETNRRLGTSSIARSIVVAISRRYLVLDSETETVTSSFDVVAA